MALNIDIAPTILSMAGVTVPKEMQGINLIDLVENKIQERNEFFYQHYYIGGQRIPRVEAVVTKDFKYINWIENNVEELFDIRHDPHETENLVKDQAYKGKLNEFRKRYHQLKEKNGVSPKDWGKAKTAF
jgi:arylsulfatase A-like enzyme